MLYEWNEKYLHVKRQEIASRMTQLQFENDPDLEMKFGRAEKEKCKDDALFHLTYLGESINLLCKEIFSEYLVGAQSMMDSNKISKHDLLNTLQYMLTACREILPSNEFQEARLFIEYGMDKLQHYSQPGSFLQEPNPLLASAKEYLRLLLSANSKNAMLLVLNLINKDVAIADIYQFIFEVTQQEVGLLWETNQITVAHEHYCTAATQQIMSTLYTYIFNSDKKKLKLVACAISGDPHEIGIRMLSDFFEMDGWNTYYIGANMTQAEIISLIKEQMPDVFAISISTPFHIHKAKQLIDTIRIDNRLQHITVIAGGRPFNIIPRLWKKIGADGSAVNAREAVKVANLLISKK